MTAARILLTGFASVAFVGTLSAADVKKVTYEDDVLPIFRDNCLKCHNPDKLKGDLDLSTFNGTIKGGAALFLGPEVLYENSTIRRGFART